MRRCCIEITVVPREPAASRHASRPNPRGFSSTNPNFFRFRNNPRFYLEFHFSRFVSSSSKDFIYFYFAVLTRIRDFLRSICNVIFRYQKLCNLYFDPVNPMIITIRDSKCAKVCRETNPFSPILMTLQRLIVKGNDRAKESGLERCDISLSISPRFYFHRINVVWAEIGRRVPADSVGTAVLAKK